MYYIVLRSRDDSRDRGNPKRWNLIKLSKTTSEKFDLAETDSSAKEHFRKRVWSKQQTSDRHCGTEGDRETGTEEIREGTEGDREETEDGERAKGGMGVEAGDRIKTETRDRGIIMDRGTRTINKTDSREDRTDRGATEWRKKKKICLRMKDVERQ